MATSVAFAIFLGELVLLRYSTNIDKSKIEFICVHIIFSHAGAFSIACAAAGANTTIGKRSADENSLGDLSLQVMAMAVGWGEHFRGPVTVFITMPDLGTN